MSRRPLPRRAGRVRGLTLVELMVGLAVGLFVSLIAIAVFVSTRGLNAVNRANARMSENARLAMAVLQEDLRSAGFQGCRPPTAEPPVSLLNTIAEAEGFLDAAATGVAGRTGTGSAFTPALTLGLGSAWFPSLDPAPLATSDIVSVRVPADHLSLGLSTSMTTLDGNPQVGTSGVSTGSTLRQGDIVLIANCQTGNIFQVTAADPAGTGVLEHAINTAFTPGNAKTAMQQLYRGDAAVYRLQTRHYYVAPSLSRPGSNALWQRVVPCMGCADNPVELASGIDRLRITWGIDSDGDGTVNRYVGADATTPWAQVVSARVQMLVATTQDGVVQRAQAVSFAGATVSAPDRRLRTVLTEVVALRNRVP